MATQPAYLIIDIGTGNVRVAITGTTGRVLVLERENLQYVKDGLYPDALYFNPDQSWSQVMTMAEKAIARVPMVSITAVTASSQREGIVMMDADGNSLIGLSNHDHRGREWEGMVTDKHRVYNLTGRFPTSLFSALKVVGIRHRRPEIYQRFARMLSISDWVLYQLNGVENYEHSQASETLLYDVAGKRWSAELCNMFGINETVLPTLRLSGTLLGKVAAPLAAGPNLPPAAQVVVGGADTQLAIKSTSPAVDDIVIVSGTTTPIVKVVSSFITDEHQRTWTNRHVNADQFILEANAGVTGLNYQRLKEVFYPNEGYDVIEKELAENPPSLCVASLGSLIAEEKTPVTRGGFIFNTPVSHELTRAAFVRATLWDIACSIKENFDVLCSVAGSTPEFVWACGGGFQSKLLRQFIADLTGKRVLIREGYQQSSVTGAALVCNEALGIIETSQLSVEEVIPHPTGSQAELYGQWKNVRNRFKPAHQEAVV